MADQVQVETPKPATKTLTINIYAAMAIFGGSVLTTAVVTAFGIAGVLNTDHFLLQSTALAVSEIKTGYVRSDVYDANQTALSSTLRDIKDQLTLIDSKIK